MVKSLKLFSPEVARTLTSLVCLATNRAWGARATTSGVEITNLEILILLAPTGAQGVKMYVCVIFLKEDSIRERAENFLGEKREGEILIESLSKSLRELKREHVREH